MRMRRPNLTRRADLEAALKRVKPVDVLMLQDLAKLWGTSKQNFVNTLREIEKLVDVPDYRDGPAGAHVYPAKKMLVALLAYEKRNDAQRTELQKRTRAILGQGKKKRAAAELDIPIAELSALSRVMIETEQRERDQGRYVAVADVAAVAGRVFSMFSGYLSELDGHIDPNGILSNQVRAVIREGGRTLALQVHAEMKDMLAPHATPKPRRAKAAGSPDGGSRGASPRRPSRPGVPRKAR